MICPICNTKELTGKQKYCSGACRVKASRQLANARPAIKKTEVVDEALAELAEVIPIKDGHLVVENVPQYKLKLTPADLEYQAYYEGNTGHQVNFQEKLATRKCYICRAEFKTHLEMLKFCSLKCRNQFLSPVI